MLIVRVKALGVFFVHYAAVFESNNISKYKFLSDSTNEVYAFLVFKA
jgi:hypothetical protein